MREPQGLSRTSPERRLFTGDLDPFSLTDYNNRPAPRVKVVGFGDLPDGTLIFLGCGHSLPWEQTDDIPIYGAEVGCERCKEAPPIQADGGLR